MTRLIAFAIVTIAATLLPWWGWLLVAGLYVLWFAGIEVIVVAAGLDAYLGFSFGLPLYTFFVAVLTIILLAIRPVLSINEYRA